MSATAGSVRTGTRHETASDTRSASSPGRSSASASATSVGHSGAARRPNTSSSRSDNSTVGDVTRPKPYPPRARRGVLLLRPCREQIDAHAREELDQVERHAQMELDVRGGRIAPEDVREAFEPVAQRVLVDEAGLGGRGDVAVGGEEGAQRGDQIGTPVVVVEQRAELLENHGADL